MYGHLTSPCGRWALTPPFHPYRTPQDPAVILCYIVFAVARDFPLGSMALYVARTFLLACIAADTATDGPAVFLIFILHSQVFL